MLRLHGHRASGMLGVPECAHGNATELSLGGASPTWAHRAETVIASRSPATSTIAAAPLMLRVAGCMLGVSDTGHLGHTAARNELDPLGEAAAHTAGATARKEEFRIVIATDGNEYPTHSTESRAACPAARAAASAPFIMPVNKRNLKVAVTKSRHRIVPLSTPLSRSVRANNSQLDKGFLARYNCSIKRSF